MSTILWDPSSESDFSSFKAAIETADEQIAAAKRAIENLYNINKGLTISALHESFEGELYPQWKTHYGNLQGYLQQVQASYNAAMQQDQENAGRAHQ